MPRSSLPFLLHRAWRLHCFGLGDLETRERLKCCHREPEAAAVWGKASNKEKVGPFLDLLAASVGLSMDAAQHLVISVHKPSACRSQLFPDMGLKGGRWAGRVCPAFEEARDPGPCAGGVSSRVDWSHHSCFSVLSLFDLVSKIFGVKLISAVSLCPFHTEETW